VTGARRAALGQVKYLPDYNKLRGRTWWNIY